MESLPPRFEEFNETDVREEIIAPLLRRLGYSSRTDNNIIREQPLRYAKSFLGRKNPSKDPELRGVADYILEAKWKSSRGQCAGARTVLDVCPARGVSAIRKRIRFQAPILTVSLKNVECRDGRMGGLDLY